MPNRKIKRVRIYQPSPMSFKQLAALSFWLADTLSKQRIIPEAYLWNGKLSSIPVHAPPSLIRISQSMDCTVAQIAHFAKRHGHFLFFGRFAILSDETYVMDQDAAALLSHWLAHQWESARAVDLPSEL